MAHIPVLLDAVVEVLHPARRLIDGTLGAGGHTRALLAGGVQEALGLDCDPAALAKARQTLSPYTERVYIVHASYADMVKEARRIGWDAVDGILLDLGLSSMQLDTAERGFAFMQDGPLDMRFNPQSDRPTAAELVNYLDESELADLFYRYGEEPQGKRLSRAIIAGRPYHTTRELATVIETALPRRKGDKIHPATRAFQALRIAVNDELSIIERVLPEAIDLLMPGGRLAVISFHSLEDRLVKQAFKLASTDCICPPKTPICVCGHQASVRLINRKPIVAGEDEIQANPRSRSAKLRVVEKLTA
ncbi:MAG: 16S rRNA (cytosine(1402)-N(4))-methyltransferase RsmH [Anaerolineaceae bacterium]|nr:16S rRNA (cytosine(1402)-N(4))-methyltransferase RsmH [Anaerolineaceae bacterium]